jgi:dihydroneopterin triphosphate diphosphatase
MEIKSKMIEAHVFKETKNDLEFLLLKRSGKVIYPGLWQMVNGKIKEGEKAYQTAVREIKEETGLTPLKFWVVPNVNSFYSQDDNSIMMLPVFAAQVSESSPIILSDEHSDYKWADQDSAKKLLAWEGQRRSIDLIVKYFKEEINFLNLVEMKLFSNE